MGPEEWRWNQSVSQSGGSEEAQGAELTGQDSAPWAPHPCSKSPLVLEGSRSICVLFFGSRASGLHH